MSSNASEQGLKVSSLILSWSSMQTAPSFLIHRPYHMMTNLIT